jgi:cell division protein FtsB
MSLTTWKGGRKDSASSRNVPHRLGLNIAISLYAGFLLYCGLSVLAGPAGVSAYRRLEARKAAMESNLNELEGIRGRLGAELESLKSSPDRAALEARSLGYLREGETVVILGDTAGILGGKEDRVAPIDSGAVLPYAEPPALDDSTLKAIALGAALAMLAFLCAPRAATGKAESRRRP